MEGLLKGSCDHCTQSKVKCVGGIPCKRCVQKNITCTVRPRKKRGPKAKNKGGASKKQRVVSSDDFAYISSYEKRVWNVFFTMFKNQNRTRSDAPWAFCWFVNQLDKLKKHVTLSGNVSALNRLNVWLEALDVDLASIVKGVTKKCSFDSSMCGSCSAIAMSAPGEKSNDSLISQIHVGENFDLDLKDHRPRLIMENTTEGSKIRVNETFQKQFGSTGKELEDIMSWSGNGSFLPWGGDLLAKMLVKETDLHVFLQILAIKFQALGPPKHGKDIVTERQIPSTHIFDIWCTNDENGKLEMVATYMLRCIHFESIIHDSMSTTLKLAFEKVGEKRKPVKGEIMITCDQPQKKQFQVKKEQRQLKTPLPTTYNQPVNAPIPPPGQQPPQVNNVKKKPVITDNHSKFQSDAELLQTQYGDYIGNWNVFGQEQQNYYSNNSILIPQPPPEVVQNQQSSPSAPLGDPGAADFEDSAWLNSLLEWSHTNIN